MRGAYVLTSKAFVIWVLRQACPELPRDAAKYLIEQCPFPPSAPPPPAPPSVPWFGSFVFDNYKYCFVPYGRTGLTCTTLSYDIYTWMVCFLCAERLNRRGSAPSKGENFCGQWVTCEPCKAGYLAAIAREQQKNELDL